jgi:SPP1 gp7 family putative phage head morphogenesis protein
MARAMQTKSGKSKGANPLRIDPTRTSGLRRSFEKQIASRFARLKFKIHQLLLEEDALGLLPDPALHPTFAREVANAFCPTGSGGGIDPSCSLGSMSGPNDSDDSADKFMERIDAGEGEGDARYQEIGAALTDEHPKILVKSKGSVVGAASYQSNKGIATIHQLGSIQKGSGSVLVRQLQNKHRRVIAKTVREEARTFYEKLGFRPSRISPNDMVWDRQEQQATNVTNAGRWQFNSTPEKVKAFKTWLKEQLRSELVGKSEQEIWEAYTKLGLQKGAGRAFDDTKRPQRVKEQLAGRLDFYQGSRDEFLRSSFNRPVAVEKVQLLAGRSFDELENITSDMATRMTRSLTDGLVRGAAPREIARDLDDDLGIGLNRARTIARTEIIRAHAEGQLMALEEMGVEEVGVAVEWATAGDEKVCELCAPLEGVVLKIEEAKGLLPRHPNCRCAFLPANVGEDDKGQKDTKAAIGRALDISVEREGGFDESRWQGADLTPSRDRPQSILGNELTEFSKAMSVINCGGPGSGVPGPCPGGGREDSSSGHHTKVLESLQTKFPQLKSLPPVNVTVHKGATVPKNPESIGSAIAEHEEQYGSYSHGQNEINIAEGARGGDFETAFLHEYGHHVQDYLGKDIRVPTEGNSRGKSWQMISRPYVGEDAPLVHTEYERRNHKEMFAESFAKYAGKNYKRGTLPKPIEGFFDYMLSHK